MKLSTEMKIRMEQVQIIYMGTCYCNVDPDQILSLQGCRVVWKTLSITMWAHANVVTSFLHVATYTIFVSLSTNTSMAVNSVESSGSISTFGVTCIDWLEEICIFFRLPTFSKLLHFIAWPTGGVYTYLMVSSHSPHQQNCRSTSCKILLMDT